MFSTGKTRMIGLPCAAESIPWYAKPFSFSTIAWRSHRQNS